MNNLLPGFLGHSAVDIGNWTRIYEIGHFRAGKVPISGKMSKN
jgi:hypothetical protein